MNLILTRKLAVAAAFLTALPLAVEAQETTGNLEGRVVSADGLALVSVTVTASGPYLQRPRQASTDERGYFRMLALPVGEYTVSVTQVGYRPLTYSSVHVQLARTTTLGEARLESQAVELGVVTVTAERPLIDPATAANGTNLASETFATLPTTRDFRSIIALAPQANASGLPEDAVNVAGGTGPENVYFIDGVNITDAVLGATSTDLPYNFVREIQLKAGGYEAEYGRAMGGLISVITHSGGNQFHGQVSGFFTGRSLTGEPRFPAPGTKQEAFSEYDVGGSLGGPIARDRLWFFLAYNPSFRQQTVHIPGVRLPSDSRTAHLFAGKLTWQAGPNTDVVLTALGDPARHREFNRGLSVDSVLNPDAVLAIDHSGGLVVSMDVTQRLGSQTQLSLSLARVGRDNSVEPETELGRTAPGFKDIQYNYLSGGLGFISRQRTVRTAIRGSITRLLGPHTLKAGVEYEDNLLDLDFSSNGTTGGGAGFIIRIDDTTFLWRKERDSAHVRNRIPTGYLQDSWRVTRRATLNAGLRWDEQFLIGADGRVVQSFTGEWQPRLGFTYQVGELGLQKLFGSYGRFYEQMPLNLVATYYIPFEFELLGYDHDPRLDPGGANTLRTIVSTNTEPRHDLVGEHVDEFTLGYERAQGRFRIGVRGIYRTVRWVVEDAIDTTTDEVRIGNPGRGVLAFAPRARREYTALVLTFEKPRGQRFDFGASYVLSRTYGNYEGLYDYEGEIANPNVGSQFDTPQQISTGLLSNDHTHVVKLYGTYRFDFGLTVGTFVAWQRGAPRNELGGSSFGLGYSFLRPRGSAGRTNALFDANLRLSYGLSLWGGTSVRPRVQLDVLHLGSQRTTLSYDDVHYTAVDSNGNQAAPNPNYGRGSVFQPPTSVRLGLVADF